MTPFDPIASTRRAFLGGGAASFGALALGQLLARDGLAAPQEM